MDLGFSMELQEIGKRCEIDVCCQKIVAHMQIHNRWGL